MSGMLLRESLVLWHEAKGLAYRLLVAISDDTL